MWKTRGTDSITGLTSWSDGEAFGADEIDDIDDDLRTWGSNVDAAGYRLTNCAGVDGPTGAAALTFKTNATERARFTGAGTLELSGSTFGTPVLTIPGSQGYALLGDRGILQSWPLEGLAGTYIAHNAVHHGGVGWKNLANASYSAIQVGTGFVAINVGASPGAAGSVISLAERLRIDINGNVGIGTNTPTAPLQVVGTPTYASDAAAGSGGLTAGAMYKHSDGSLHIKL